MTTFALTAKSWTYFAANSAQKSYQTGRSDPENRIQHSSRLILAKSIMPDLHHITKKAYLDVWV